MLPLELRGFNFGAFMLTVWWGFWHRLWWMSLALIVCNKVPGLWIISLIVSIYIGINGNEIAWKNRRWDSIEQFKNVQKNWRDWGIAFFVILILAIIFYIAVSD